MSSFSTNQLSDIISLCQKIGQNIPYWTQGAGGNISQKIDGMLWVKSSGWRLDQIGKKSLDAGLSFVDIENFHIGYKNCHLNDEQKYADLLLQVSEGPRPSMETAFHALLPKKFVIHFHSLISLLMFHYAKKNLNKWQEFIVSNSNQEIKLIDVIIPGLELAQKISQFPTAHFFILQNHGVILHDDSPEILEQWKKFENDFLEFYNIDFKTPPSINFQNKNFKLYFPDTVVFREKILAALNSSETIQDNKYVNLLEIYLASEILFHNCHDLEEFPIHLFSKVENLPTEKFRLEKNHDAQ